jgi:hypothetical protein
MPEVFISHIAEEKPIALVLQKHLKRAFGDGMEVFVSSDARSIGGGQKWYNYILQTLRSTRVILVLVSQESKRREWINFEAGVGEGREARVIPVAIKNFPLSQLPYPLAGFQGRSVDDIGSIIDDIGNVLGSTPSDEDALSYEAEIAEAERTLIYKSLKVEPVPDQSFLRFDIENVGTVDLELLMLEVYIPQSLLPPYTNAAVAGAGIGLTVTRRNDQPYIWAACCSQRGVYGNLRAILRPIITPSMGKVRPGLEIPILTGMGIARELSIFFQIHAIGYTTEEEERRIADLNWP